MGRYRSDNARGADNQQERLGMSYWISGFTDGEGCFTISVIKNSTTTFGKQLFPEFVITQGEKSLATLMQIQRFFGCGSVVRNKRYDNHTEDLYRYCVRSISDLQNRIVPFFEHFQLRTNKRNDFLVFKKAIAMMARKEHLTERGWKRILALAAKMNRKKVRT